ncbi:FKBP-type peptidyl-prolyl cis-trans isomerase fkpA precursor [Serratia quinivorans]|nr:FKBP-type peptidyl-prolyl cis-trans isomerase fkpA precursor [Serratia quinivorans]CAI1056127.1 FKBP-type peptidyl-prolyl cis-trans isomerase fkpA precursor [Serratia quinivorans]CAI1135732.1 FKBP-type peptidyl-prolyl cis-trans isomerase fkpA precursor [Serratia quinivorans]CAI1142597.1 FKBP-type peptidyl-prolyl cis-trans isomerase fkpA precursor [Serratia quinivorans]CAI1216254.1 FKBP-type peptidyl-prolyl cis-trans isomerase fkpA precursor [Serratia quinivorans]
MFVSPEMDRVLESLFSAVSELRNLMFTCEEGKDVLHPALDTPVRQEAYVSGVDLGRRALLLLEQHAYRGVRLEQDVVLAGMVDTFRQRVQLSSCELEEITARVNERVARVMQQSASEHDFAWKNRVMYEHFLQRTGMRYGKEGMLYVVTEPGYGPRIQDCDTVALYLTGRLADGSCFEPRGALRIPQEIEVLRLCSQLRHVVKQLRWGGEAQVLIPAFSLTHRVRSDNETNCDVNLSFDVKIKRKG